MGYPYKTEPLEPQRIALRRSAGLPYFFLSMEQGTGKSKVIIDTMGYLYLNGKIDGAIILAPNGVHAAWVYDQLPTHMSDAVLWRAHIWQSGKERGLFHQRKKTGDPNWAIGDLARAKGVLAILVVNSEAITLPLVQRAVGTFLTQRQCLFVVDESGDFTTPSAKRTKVLMKWRNRAPYRRCLDGTPVGTEPLELYAPYRFLHPSIIGAETYAQMKETYALWDTFERGDNGREFKVIRKDPKTGKKAWINLDQLAQRIAPYTYRVTKQEALPHLPPKVFHKRFFEMTEEQWRLTQELHQDYTTQLEGGGTVTATNVLTQYLRYQQISCGYVPPDIVYGEETEPVRVLPGPNPRLELAVEEILRHGRVPQIIWTRFQFDLDILATRLRAEGFRLATYDGRTTQAEREAAIRDFMSGHVELFVGNPAAGGRGLNLYRAQHVLYYANYFGLRRRLQSEDRAHRIGTKTVVNYTDLLGARSIDLTIVRALRNNQEVADIITGDPAKEWI